MIKITKQQVQGEIQSICTHAMDRLASDIDTADRRGYHAYATELSNVKLEIERARNAAIERLEDMA